MAGSSRNPAIHSPTETRLRFQGQAVFQGLLAQKRLLQRRDLADPDEGAKKIICLVGVHSLPQQCTQKIHAKVDEHNARRLKRTNNPTPNFFSFAIFSFAWVLLCSFWFEMKIKFFSNSNQIPNPNQIQHKNQKQLPKKSSKQFQSPRRPTRQIQTVSPHNCRVYQIFSLDPQRFEMW